MFHVKHAIASVAKICLHIFMTEHEHVGHEVSKHFCSELKFSITFLENNSQTPLPYKNHKIVVDNILINVEKLLSRESCGKHACMLSITEPTNIALAQNLLRFECEDVLAQSSYSNRHSSDEVQKLLSRELRKQKISC